MKITTLALENIRGFKSTSIALSPKINLLVGKNNAGKSTIIKALYLLQNINALNYRDITIGKKQGKIKIGFENPINNYIPPENILSRKRVPGGWEPAVNFDVNVGTQISPPYMAQYSPNTANTQTLRMFASAEPGNFIYPFLSRRKATQYNETISLSASTSVSDDLSNLYSKVDRIASPEHPAYIEFKEFCHKILDFPVSAFSSQNGKMAGLLVDNFENISLQSMGEGTANILGLIVHLCVSKDKLFLIEEIENDIHPEALKALLELIIKKSQSNQFVISTHSNIVTKYLGSETDSKIFNVKMNIEERIPKSSIIEINNTQEERIKILKDLGYDLWDYDLGKGWLILEESSAERLIKDYFISWYVPDLKEKLRTISANGVKKVEPTFEDFRRLFVFIHLEKAYQNNAWIIVDGDKDGIDTVKEMRSKFSAQWNEENFQHFKYANFEEYYPSEFHGKIEVIEQMPKGQQKREKKKELLYEVLAWIENDTILAKEKFAESAKEVIEKLQNIANKLK